MSPGRPLKVATNQPDLAATGDLAQLGEVCATSTDLSYPVVGAVDGSAATSWKATQAGAALTVDLGGVRSVKKVSVTSGSEATMPYTVAVSTDGSYWTDQGSVAAGSDPASSVTIDQDLSVQYVRYTATGTDVPATLGATKVTKVGSSYTATLVLPQKLAAGSYANVTASLPGTSTTLEATSPASATTFRVLKASTSKVTVKTYHRGKKTTVKVTVARLNNGAQASGKVTVYVGEKKAGVAPLKNSKARVTIAKRFTTAKRITVTAVFVPSDAANIASTTSKEVVLTAKKHGKNHSTHHGKNHSSER